VQLDGEHGGDRSISISVDGEVREVEGRWPEVELRGFPVRDHEGRPRTRPTTVLEAVHAGVEESVIPTLCHRPGLPPVGMCRLCMVAVEEGGGRGRGGARGRRLQPACCLTVEPGMEIHTLASPDPTIRKQLHAAVTMLLNLLRADHPAPCMPPVAGGVPACELEALARRFQIVPENNPFAPTNP
jgi:NADH dehydrogenase/NADH:ubiquinone oxidoreductase subunit G